MTTDSIAATEAVRVAKNIRRLTIAPLMAEAIRRISEERSVSSLFALGGAAVERVSTHGCLESRFRRHTWRPPPRSPEEPTHQAKGATMAEPRSTRSRASGREGGRPRIAPRTAACPASSMATASRRR